MNDQACLFCRIINGDIPANVVERTQTYMIFRDIAPQAPEHLLIIPLRHTPSLSATQDAALLGEMLAAAGRLGQRVGEGNGFRVVINDGAHGGQAVNHLHLHCLAGRALHWPPG